MKSQEKLIQFVALTLSNMSSSSTAKLYLKSYETELMTIGFSDDSLAGIISNILSELSHWSSLIMSFNLELLLYN